MDRRGFFGAVLASLGGLFLPKTWLQEAEAQDKCYNKNLHSQHGCHNKNTHRIDTIDISWCGSDEDRATLVSDAFGYLERDCLLAKTIQINQKTSNILQKGRYFGDDKHRIWYANVVINPSVNNNIVILTSEGHPCVCNCYAK